MLKRELLLIALLSCLFNLKAKVKNNMKLEIETGFLLFTDSENLGIFLNVEPKRKILKSAFMGVRFGVALNSQKFEIHDVSQFNIDNENDHAVISFVPTFDDYLSENNIRSYLGLGRGVYLLSDIDVFRVVVSPSEEEFEVLVNNQVGVLLRGGFELGTLRFGLGYNCIKKADIEAPNGQVIRAVDSSYFGLCIGYAIGGGKNSK